MKIVLSIFLSLASVITLFGQRVKTFDTDSFTYHVDTVVSFSQWGDASFTFGQHNGTATHAYSSYDGSSNTINIVDSLGAGKYAAYRCDTLTLNSKSDWFLPSVNEAKDIYTHINDSGYFQSAWYWTSTEPNNGPSYGTSAWKKWFGEGEGDILELTFKMDEYIFGFCIRKEAKVITKVNDIAIEKGEGSFIYYDLTGKETSFVYNQILFKVYENRVREKLIVIR
ncbi:MAG: hypothetical protein ACJAZ2_001537 [Glaciecola sp.]|jgi:hypothetical protein